MTDQPLPPDLRFVVLVWGVMIVWLVGMSLLALVSLVSGCGHNAELVDPRLKQPTAVKRPITLPRTDQGGKP